MFKKLAANNAAAVASTVPANLTDFSGKPNTFLNVSIISWLPCNFGFDESYNSFASFKFAA